MIHSMWADIFKYSKHKTKVQLLKNTAIFKGLSRYDLIKISSVLHERSYSAGEFIFKEGEPGESMYIIRSGSIEISTIKKNKHISLAKLGQGSFFGEISLVDDDPRAATARAEKDSEILGFFRADLMHLIDRNPRLASFILLQLAMVIGKRLRHKNGLIHIDD